MQVLMCQPRYFTVTEKDPENRYMDPFNLPDRELSFRQHENLAQVYGDLGLGVWFIEPVKNLSDMVFTANSAFICDGKAFLANFKPDRRRGETAVYAEFYEAFGYEVIRPPAELCFEGAGDALMYRDKILLGCGFRTDKKIKPWLEKTAGKEVVLLELVKPLIGDMIFYHADTAILPFEEEEKFVLYAGAFTKASLDRLDALGRIYSVSYADAVSLSLNGVIVKRKDMSFLPRANFPKAYHGAAVLTAAASKRVQNTIEHIGYKPILVDVSEFLKSGGGPFCMTKVLY